MVLGKRLATAPTRRRDRARAEVHRRAGRVAKLHLALVDTGSRASDAEVADVMRLQPCGDELVVRRVFEQL